MTHFHFADFHFDAQSLQLSKHGEIVKIRPKCVEILRFLLLNRQRPVRKEELLENFWPGVTVSENVLFQAIRDIRNTLAAGDDQNTYILTFPKQGYQWVYGDTRVDDHVIEHDDREPSPLQSRVSEITPTSPSQVTLPRIALALSLVIALGLALWWMSDRTTSEEKPTTGGDRAIVFSFKNLNDASQLNWMGIALAEGIRAEINGLNGVFTLSGDGTQQLQGDLDLKAGEPFSTDQMNQIRRYSRCRFLITGSILADGQNIRIHWYLNDSGGKDWTSGTRVAEKPSFVSLIDQVSEDIRLAMGPTASPALFQADALPVKGDSLRYFAEGLEKFRLMDSKAAASFFEKAIQEDPDSLRTRINLSQAFAQLGDLKSATKLAKQAVAMSRDSDQKSRLTTEANLLEIEQYWARAAELFQALWLMDPGNRDLGIRATHVHIEAGDTEAAVRNLNELRLLENPDDPRLDLLEARIAGITGDHLRQLEIAKTATENAENLGARSLAAHGYLTQSKALFLAGDNTLALERAEKASTLFRDLGQFSGYSRARSTMGDIHNKKGNIDEAVPFFEEALEHFSHLGDTSGIARMNLRLGLIQRKKRNFAEGAQLMETAVAHFRETGSHELAQALSVLGLTKISLGEFDKATELITESNFLFRKAGELYPITLNNCNLALISLQKGHRQDAIRLYEEALKMAVKSGEKNTLGSIIHNLAQLYFKDGQLEKSREYFENALEIETKNNRPAGLAALKYRLAKVHFEQSRYEQAAKGFAEAKAIYESIDRKFDVHNVSLDLAEILLQKGDFSGAEKIADTDFEAVVEADNVYYIQNALFRARLEYTRHRYKEALNWIEIAESKDRSGRLSYQIPKMKYLKARILVAQGFPDKAQAVVNQTEPQREKASNVFFDLEKELVQTEIHLKKGDRALAQLKMNDLKNHAQRIGAYHLLNQASQLFESLLDSAKVRVQR